MTGAPEEVDRSRRLRRSMAVLPHEQLRAIVRSLGADEQEEVAARLGFSSARALRAAHPSRVRSELATSATATRERVAFLLVQPCAARTIELLGDRYQDPSVSDMEVILDDLLTEYPVPVVRLMLASYAVEGFQCKETFDELLDRDARFAFDSPPESSRPPRRPGTEDEEKKAARRRRKQEKRDAERAAVERARELRKAPTLRARLALRATDAEPRLDDQCVSRSSSGSPRPTAARPSEARRPVVLVHQYSKELRQDDPFVGSVVFAEVIFGGVVGAKWRPAVVVAASRYFVVVRPCYSEGGFRSYDWRSTQLRDWQDAGLDRPTWVSHEERLIPRRRLGHVFGEVSEYDWVQL